MFSRSIIAYSTPSTVSEDLYISLSHTPHFYAPLGSRSMYSSTGCDHYRTRDVSPPTRGTRSISAVRIFMRYGAQQATQLLGMN